MGREGRERKGELWSIVKNLGTLRTKATKMGKSINQSF